MQVSSGQPRKPLKASPPAYNTAAIKIMMLAITVITAKIRRIVRAETLLEKFRDGDDTRLQEERHEEENHEDEREGIQPVPKRGGNAQNVGCAYHADEMLGADVCSNVATAHHVPWQMSTGEKVVLRRVAFAASGDVADDSETHQKSHKYPVVKRIERKVGPGVQQVVLLKLRRRAGLR